MSITLLASSINAATLHNTPFQAISGKDGPTIKPNTRYRAYKNRDWPSFDYTTSYTPTLQTCAEAATTNQKSFFTYNTITKTCTLKNPTSLPGAGMTVPFRNSVIWGTFDLDFNDAYDFYDADDVFMAPRVVGSISACQDWCIANSATCAMATFHQGKCYMKQPVYTSETVQDHIWHKDSFNLAVELRGNGGVQDPFLHGNCRFGDCIDDEWLVVFLLREITRRFDGLVASVTDDDGQFLLIEAADHLPQWLNPSNSANRIFVANGDLHIIPQPKTPSEIAFIPSGAHVPLDRALHVVRTHPQLTRANTDIQQAAFEKLIDFPAKLRVDGYQWAKCWVPRNIARILKAEESLIAAAVEAFYLRDPLQLRECQNMTHFHPSTNIQTSIRFTRTLYAQLISQEFPVPPKSFRLPSRDASDFKAHDLGMKVALGFEILAVAADRNGKSGDTAGRKSVETHSFDADPRWRTFHDRLIKLGYYKGELAGSALYKTLNRVAKESHLSALESAKTQTFTDNEDEELQDLQKEDVADSEVVARLHRALARVPETVPDDEIVNQAAETDDAWIRLDPEELDAVLESQFSRGLKEEDIETDGEDSDMEGDEGEDDEMNQQRKLERRAEKKQVKNLEKVVAGFGAFVEKESTVDGVLFPGEGESDLDSNEDAVLEAISDDAISDESSDNESLMDQDQNPIHIDNEKFMESLMRILSIDNTILHNSKSVSSTAPVKSKKKSNLPTAPPPSFDPTNLLLRPMPTQKTPLVTLDSSDDDAQDLSGTRGVGIVGNRRGLQEEEEDSEDEKLMSGKWDRAFLKQLEKIERAIEVGRKQSDGVGMDEDSASADDDESDIEDMKLEEYMAAMDKELSKSKVGRVGAKGKKGMFGEADDEMNVDDNEKQRRPKWKLNRMEEEGIDINSDDENDGDDDEDALDVDANLVKNLLDSFQAQQGLPGPASNILGRMGFKLPREAV
ncbi:hypothetical protein HDU78_004598 [Chytriomyces hyalinus]|nr:hypothetical protein HDU78_004598 [Chytriomyces hyalinus]